ncbi:hypothetical protein [Pseudoponticoccus marisrubri]|uniref:Uncharacterized protein n=1 Tax=Pseudoponticoccus marisrubri TaxID=1685382 RepID=A0A0W7WJ36_9RHOB|nr:hypothetical protein [Pseudoponticoccus marisrubri]KUF10629.1 hypothetical protein AVJ23_12210 [Pseudoponticoccus marisrubri]
MAPPVLIAFGMTFVGGPLLCALLLRLPHGVRTLGALAVAMALTMAAALALQGRSAAGSLAMLWLAWVLAIAMVAMALRRRASGPRLHRWVTIVALMATTLPWFGLATARMMV